MKVRCKACGQVVRVGRAAPSTVCQTCGNPVTTDGQSESVQTFQPTAEIPATSKGQLPTQDTAARNIGCVIMGVLLFGVPMFIAAITEGDNAAYWVLAIAALIALIPLGVWFERNTIRRR